MSAGTVELEPALAPGAAPGRPEETLDRVPVLVFAAGAEVPLIRAVTLVGRGAGVDLRLADPSVSRLHAELIRRGPYLYVCDAGLSRNGTCVNGELVTARLLADGDVLGFGRTRVRVRNAGPAAQPAAPTAGPVTLSERELQVLVALCRPALRAEPFLSPASNRQIAAEQYVTSEAVKQHLFHLYAKFAIPPGPDRRVTLANVVIASGLLHRRLCLHATTRRGAAAPLAARVTRPTPPIRARPR